MEKIKTGCYGRKYIRLNMLLLEGGGSQIIIMSLHLHKHNTTATIVKLRTDLQTGEQLGRQTDRTQRL